MSKSMSSYLTQYGELKAISKFNTYLNGQLKECVLNEKADLDTPLGLLTPQYEHAGIRSKHTYSVSFFPSGGLSRIVLNEQSEVKTPLGKLPAELITFYESGSIKRLFPLNGQISGYWDEDDEYNLAQEFNFTFSWGSFSTKVIGIHFYESGSIQSLTLWPKETVTIRTPLGEHAVRIGLALYPDGSVKSFEPAVPIKVKTPIGLLNSFDSTANGISGDKNSLNFWEDGTLKSLTALNTKLTVISRNDKLKTFASNYTDETYENQLLFQPLIIDFRKDKVCFNRQDEYNIKENHFKIEYYERAQNKCSDCASCRQCSL